MNAGVIAGAAVARARKRIVRDFVKADATSPERAIPYEPDLWPVSHRMFRRMVSFGAIGEPLPGRYYLDAERLDDFRASMRKRAFAMVLGVGAAVAGLLTLGE